MGLIRLIEQSPKAGPDATIAKTVALMAEENVGAIAVVEEDRVIGIFTERDLLRRVVVEGQDPATIPLSDVMSSPVHTVNDETSLSDAARLMRIHHMRYLPVLDEGGKYVGMLALRHVHNEIMRGLERRVHDLTTWLMTDSLGG